MGTQTDAQLVDLIGHAAAWDYKRSLPSTRGDLDAWIAKLRDLTDEEFFEDAEIRIYELATTGGNPRDVFCKSSAVLHESTRRHRAAGHRDDCDGPTIYSRARDAAMRRLGCEPFAVGICTCKLTKGR